MIDQCYFSTHLSATWTGNHRNASVIFRKDFACTTGCYTLLLIYALLKDIYRSVGMYMYMYMFT